MNKLRDALRTAVLTSNPYWPFSAINKYPYYIAIQAFVRLCSSYAAVKSVYLRSGLVEREWVPGLSDIDFTIVSDSALFPSDEASFLQKFWRQFAGLKRRFPMIGEVDILSDEHLRSWTRFGLAGHSARNWKLLYGNPPAQTSQPYDPCWFSQNCVDYALNYFYWYSRGFFESRFYGHTEPPYLLDHDLRRLAGKIFRCLDHIPDKSGFTEDRSLADYDEHELCARVITAVERAIRRIANFEAAAQNDSAWDTELLGEYYPAIGKQEVLDGAVFAPWGGAIESVILDFNDRFYILFRDHLDVTTLAACVAGLKRTIGKTGRVVTTVTSSGFNYLLRHYQPFEYVYLMRHRKLVFGTDPLPQIAPPSRAACARFLLNQAPNLLAFPRSRACHWTTMPDQLASMFERGLSLRLCLERDFVAATPNKTLIECERYYPQQMAALRDYRSQGNRPLTHKPFEVFNELADTIHVLVKE